MFAAQMIVAHPDPFSLRVVQALNLLAAVKLVSDDLKGQGFRYSKFAPTERPKGPVLSSKTGMTILYSPAAILCSSMLLIKLSSPAPELRTIVFASALTIHFLKRLLEVFFVHKYSGFIEMSVSCTICISYLLLCLQLLYAQNISVQLQPPSVNLMGLGVLLFLVGISGNFYHHCVLARLRIDKHDDAKKRYVIPHGGLFTWIVCPHYLFDSISFIGLAFIGQTTTAFVTALFVCLSLGARSYSTKIWYLKTIKGFPKERKAFLPLLF